MCVFQKKIIFIIFSSWEGGWGGGAKPQTSSSLFGVWGGGRSTTLPKPTPPSPPNRYRRQHGILPPAVPITSPANPDESHDPTQIAESTLESAVDTESDDEFQLDDPPVTFSKPRRNGTTPVINATACRITQGRNSQQSRSRKPAQRLEPDAKHLRLDVGKRAVLMLSHDESLGPECCQRVRAFKPTISHGSCYEEGSALRHRSRSKDTWMLQCHVNGTESRNSPPRKHTNNATKRNPSQRIVGTSWVHRCAHAVSMKLSAAAQHG